MSVALLKFNLGNGQDADVEPFEKCTVRCFGSAVRWSTYGSEAEVTYGGNAVAYRSTLRIAVRQLDQPACDEDVRAVRTMLEVVNSHWFQIFLIDIFGDFL